MKAIFALLSVLAAHLTAASAVESACPTVTTTAEYCSTCVHADCIMLKTLSNPCGCPAQVPTVAVRFPCDGKCVGGCGTAYSVETQPANCAVPTTPTVKPPHPHPTTTKSPTTKKPPPPTTLTSSAFTGCPTITTTTSVCSSCIRPMCFAMSTLTRDCRCPAEIATVTTAVACSGTCPGGCAGTSIIYESPATPCSSKPDETSCITHVPVPPHPTL